MYCGKRQMQLTPFYTSRLVFNSNMKGHRRQPTLLQETDYLGIKTCSFDSLSRITFWVISGENTEHFFSLFFFVSKMHINQSELHLVAVEVTSASVFNWTVVVGNFVDVGSSRVVVSISEFLKVSWFLFGSIVLTSIWIIIGALWKKQFIFLFSLFWFLMLTTNF